MIISGLWSPPAIGYQGRADRAHVEWARLAFGFRARVVQTTEDHENPVGSASGEEAYGISDEFNGRHARVLGQRLKHERKTFYRRQIWQNDCLGTF